MVSLAIILHNIPEGLSVSLPIFYATRSKWKGFIYGAVYAGLGEPFGGFLGYLMVKYWNSGEGLPAVWSGLAYTLTAGMMMRISVEGLIPTARALDSRDRTVTRWFFAGFSLMMFSVYLLDYSMMAYGGLDSH